MRHITPWILELPPRNGMCNFHAHFIGQSGRMVITNFCYNPTMSPGRGELEIIVNNINDCHMCQA